MKTFQGYVSVSFEVEAETEDEARELIFNIITEGKQDKLYIDIHDSDFWEDK